MANENRPLPSNKKFHLYVCKSNHEVDIAWMATLTPYISQHGWSVYSPENDFNPNLTVIVNIEQAMKNSYKILYVMSPHYVSSKMCMLETEIALKLYLYSNMSSIVIPVLISECNIPECMSPLRYIDARKPEIEWLPELLSALSVPVLQRPLLELPEGKQYHVFFVYRTVFPDKDWVKEVTKSLETHESGLKCAYHERDFIPGMTIFENITYFLKCSLKVVVVLTPDFLNSSWTKYETELAQLISMKPTSDVRIIPVVIQHCEIPQSLINLTYLDATDAFQTWWPRLLKTISIPNEELVLQPPHKGQDINTLKLCNFGGKQESDINKSWLIDLKFLESGNILVTDAKNKKVKKFSFKGLILNELAFGSRPMFFAYFDDKTAYVTFPDEPLLRIVSTSVQLEVKGEIRVPIQCSGIARIDQNSFAVVCRPKVKIYIMSRKGVKIRSIKPLIGVNEITRTEVFPSEVDAANDSDEDANNTGQSDTTGRKDFKALKQHRLQLKNTECPARLVWPGFIDTSEKQIVVTDYETCLLTIIDTPSDGDGTFYHKSIPLVDPRGVVIHDQRLFIAAGTIRIFTLNGEAVTEIPTHGGSITFPRSIAFDNTGHYMAVSHKGDGDDFISIFQLLSS